MQCDLYAKMEVFSEYYRNNMMKNSCQIDIYICSSQKVCWLFSLCLVIKKSSDLSVDDKSKYSRKLLLLSVWKRKSRRTFTSKQKNYYIIYSIFPGLSSCATMQCHWPWHWIHEEIVKLPKKTTWCESFFRYYNKCFAVWN